MYPGDALDLIFCFISDCFKTKWGMLAGEGTGLLRLHSTYRHDLKIYSSDEGRVQVHCTDLVLRYYLQSSVYPSSVLLPQIKV